MNSLIFLNSLDSLPSLLAFSLATGNLWVAYSEMLIYIILSGIFILISTLIISSAVKFIELAIKLPLISLGLVFASTGMLMLVQTISIFLGGPWHFFNIVAGIITISTSLILLITIHILKPVLFEIINMVNKHE